MIDYKFAYIKRDDHGWIEEVAIRFFEGNYKEIEGKQVYVREKRLKKIDIGFDGKESKDINSNPVFIYTQEDFGEIKEDDELRVFLNTKIALDDREPIKEQKETDLVKLKKLKIK